MNTSLRKKIINAIVSEHKTQESIDVLDTLIVLMKKFGKQLSQSPVKEFVAQEYADASALYILLGGSRLTIKDILSIKQHLYESLGEGFLVSGTTHDNAAKKIQESYEDVVLHISGDEANPVLSVHSPKKIYKRSLYGDLQKLV